jgi:hypothetical protein
MRSLLRTRGALTGQFLIDDEVLKGAGVTDFSVCRDPGVTEDELIPDFFL